MGERKGMNFHDGLRFLQEAFKSDTKASETKESPPKPATNFTDARSHKASAVVAQQSTKQATGKREVKKGRNPQKKQKSKLATPQRPSNVPPNPGKFSFGALKPFQPPAQRPSRVNTPAELLGVPALNYVNARVNISAVRGEVPPPTTIDQDEADDLQSCLRAGANLLSARPLPDETGFLVGFDFGTSSSKIVVHQPGAGDLAYTLPVPEALRVIEQGRCQQHLWRSVVWFCPDDGRFT